MRIKLPTIYCPHCRTQLAYHMYFDTRLDELICGFCARDYEDVSMLLAFPEPMIRFLPDVPVMTAEGVLATLLSVGAEVVEESR